MERVASRGPLTRGPGALKRVDTSQIVNVFVAVEGGPFGEKTNFRKKVSQCRKTERGDPLRFLNTQSVSNEQKIDGGPFGENFFPKNSLAVPKKIERGDLLVSPGMVCYAGKQEKPFWFSSLGQMVQ